MALRQASAARGLKDIAIVTDLHALAPVCDWPTGRCDPRWLERFAQMREGLTSRGRSHPGLLPLANLRFEVNPLLPAVSSEPDVAAARWALEWNSFPTRAMISMAARSVKVGFIGK